MDDLLQNKSYKLALRIVKLYKFLTLEKKEYVLSKQILRSGTAIGALISEAEFAQSTADFIHKLSISLKEANETRYWLNLLKDSDYLEGKLHCSLINEVEEILKILVSSIRTLKIKHESQKRKQ